MESKQKIIEDMPENVPAHKETARKCGINDRQVQGWERIYIEEGVEGLYAERRGRKSKAGPG